MFRLSRLFRRKLAQSNRPLFDISGYRTSDVNIVDEIEQPEGLALSEPSTYPAGEQPDKQTLFHPTKQLQKPRSISRGRQSQLRDEDIVRMDEVNEAWGLPDGVPADASDQSNIQMAMAAIGANTVDSVFNALEDARQACMYEIGTGQQSIMSGVDAILFQTWEPEGSIIVQVTVDPKTRETLVEYNLGGDRGVLPWDDIDTARAVYDLLRLHVEQALHINSNMYGTQSPNTGERISRRKVQSEFGVNLDELAAPSSQGIGIDNPADNHQSENDFEDPDLKMGQVEEPYSTSSGPMNVRFEDDKKYDIVKGAQVTPNMTPEEQVRWDEREQNWGTPTPSVVEDVSDDANKIDRSQVQPTDNEDLESEAVLYLTNTLNVTFDWLFETLNDYIDTVVDSIMGYNNTTMRTSNQLVSVRYGPHVFSYTIVFDGVLYAGDQISIDITAALNGTGRYNSTLDLNLGGTDILDVHGRANVYGIAVDIWRDIISAVDANLYWLDPESYTIEMPKEGVGLIEGPVVDENISGNDYGRADSAIPRPHAKEKLIYSK